MNENQHTAQALIEQLVQRKMLELQGNTDPSSLTAGITQVLTSQADLRQRASALAQWLMGQDSVAELYASDEELASLMQQG